MVSFALLNAFMIYCIIGVRLYSEQLRPPYTIPDFSILSTRSFYTGYYTRMVLFCQSSSYRNNIGEWLLPNGFKVQDFMETSVPPYSVQFRGQILLIIDKATIEKSPGLYRCIIPDKNRVSQTLVVGLYGDAQYDANG